MKKRNLLLAALLLILVAPSFAAKVDTLLVNSPSMNKDVQVVVVTPDAALGKKSGGLSRHLSVARLWWKC